MSAFMYFEDAVELVADVAKTTAHVFSAGVAEVGKGLIDASSIVHQENKALREAEKAFRDISKRDFTTDNRQDYVERIISYFDETKLFNSDQANKIIKKNSNIEAQLDTAQKLLFVQEKFDVLNSNIEELNDVAEKNQLQINYILLEFVQLKEKAHKLSVPEIEKAMESIDNKIEMIFDQVAKLHEEEIRNRTYQNHYVKLSKVEEKLFVTLFHNEFIDFLDKPETEEIHKIANTLNTARFNKKLLDQVVLAAGLDGFEEFSDRILRLYSSSLRLSQRDISVDDYQYEMNLKAIALKDVLKELENKEKEILNQKRRWIILFQENNKYRSDIGLPPYQATFNKDTAASDIDSLINENKELAIKANDIAVAKKISTKLKLKYIREGYEYIPVSKTEQKKLTVVEKSYFIAPDKQSVLCVNVNSNGKIFQKLVGVKVQGLADDIKGTLEAQQQFCSHSRKIFEELYGEKATNANRMEPTQETAISENFNGILPQYAINKVTEHRNQKRAAERKARVVNG